MNYQKISDTDFNIDVDENDDIIIQPDSAPQVQQQQQQQQKSSSSLPPAYSSELPQSSGDNSSKVKKTYEGGYFSINYYRQFFDLNTAEFFKNCYQSLNPLSELPCDSYQSIGDLYGSIWISATLIVLLFFCNTVAELLSSIFANNNENKINYFKILIYSINLLYGYTILIPLAIYLLLWFYFKVTLLIPLSKIISIYSYANLLWLPAAVLSVFRGLLVNHSTLDTLLKWTCIAIGGILSGISIFIKLNNYLSQALDIGKNIYFFLAFLVICHLLFTIGVKVSFFGDL